MSHYLEATVADVLTIVVYATTGLLSRINDHLGFRDQQGCPSFQRFANGCNSCPDLSNSISHKLFVISTPFNPLSGYMLSSQPYMLLIVNPCRASFNLSSTLVAMYPATNPSLGVVTPFFVSLHEGRYLRFLPGIRQGFFGILLF